MSKHKSDNKTQFIDASGLFAKDTNNNILSSDHIDNILQVFDKKNNVDNFARLVEFSTIASNNYNLSVSSYVEAKDDREEVDIIKINDDIRKTVAKISELRSEIDKIIVSLGGN